MGVGGNIHALLQVKGKGAKNGIGACEYEWLDCTSILGWLDLSTGDSKYTSFNAKVQESTHIFLCDFTNLKDLSTKWVWNPFSFLTGIVSRDEQEGTVDVTSENARMVIQGLVYEILLIDNPMNMNEHLEIYLRFIGGGSNMSVEFEDYSVEVKAALESAAIAFLHEAAGELQSRTRRNSRVDTGQTKGSYDYNVDTGDLKATIGSNLENAIWEEFGTGEYALHGDGRKGGWVFKDAKGNYHFTRGKTPNRPLHNAFTALKNKIIRMAEEKFKGVG